ncbi:hypothetical protein A1OE_894 [Candidatus Endolissoclinum faulkneri L2]|uniref:Uncharacterized protein n=1 Tax=Candidatus Endolissoclinum faulkneri L2 TaxID=1193729 RepID=K7Z4W5_9PROT|nr:hypothetical protein A1OE_894 [Candidatus Endolissoclinum faulkneri L2]
MYSLLFNKLTIDKRLNFRFISNGNLTVYFIYYLAYLHLAFINLIL